MSASASGPMSSVIVAPPEAAQRCAKSAAPTRVRLATFGCKVNAFESELIGQKLADLQYQRVDADQPTDVFVVNTCTVTAEADRQARQQIRRVIRRNPAAWVVVTGCYAQIDPAACAAIPGVDLVVGNSRKLDIPALLAPLYRGLLPPVMVDDVDREISLPDQLLTGFAGRTRAFVQIQQGCSQGCTFCIIHTARGPNRSFSMRMIRRQVERLVMNCYREIVICGVDIGSYGDDMPEQSIALADLLAQLVTIQGDFRLRLSSIDPAHISDQLIELIAREPKICRQLHLSLQSGNTLILKRMKRRATRAVLYQRIAQLRQCVPDMVLSADILVGFPTEEAVHFADTLAAVEQLEIPFPHVFPYSSRAGTPAARIVRQVPVAVRKQRAAQIRAQGRSVWRRVARRQVGRRFKVLLESVHQQHDLAARRLRGRADNYFAVEIHLPAGQTPPPQVAGDWLEVNIIGVGERELIARTAA